MSQMMEFDISFPCLPEAVQTPARVSYRFTARYQTTYHS